MHTTRKPRRFRLDADAREERNAARVQIVQVANQAALARHRKSRNPFKPPPRLLSMAQLQKAVSIARRKRLVSDDVLVAAGFNPAPALPADESTEVAA